MIADRKTLLACAFGALAFSAIAAEPPRSTYQQERAACSDPQVEDQKACVREAGAAQYEARRGTLGQENTEFEKNQLARCGYHSNRDEREWCERRMRGEGTISGSVQGGGIIRELTVTVPAEEAPK